MVHESDRSVAEGPEETTVGGLLEGKRGVVMGVANERSIAWACAQACAEQGAALAFNYLGDALEKRVRKLADEIPGALAFPCDVSKDAEITDFFEQLGNAWGRVDFLIHSIAYADKNDLRGRFSAVSRHNFLMALDISAYSLVAVAREVQPLMTAGGSIVSMTYYGAEKAVPNYNVMGVAKATLEASTRYLAADFGPENIRVNCISAGPIKTLAASAIPGLKLMLETSERYSPLRRNVSQEDVARSALYLVSDLSSGVTGEVVHVDAGYHVLGMFADPEPETD